MLGLRHFPILTLRRPVEFCTAGKHTHLFLAHIRVIWQALFWFVYGNYYYQSPFDLQKRQLSNIQDQFLTKKHLSKIGK